MLLKKNKTQIIQILARLKKKLTKLKKHLPNINGQQLMLLENQ